MLKLRIDELMTEFRTAVVNEELGIEKQGEFNVHPAQAREYLKSVLAATDMALQQRLGLTPVDPPAKR